MVHEDDSICYLVKHHFLEGLYTGYEETEPKSCCHFQGHYELWSRTKIKIHLFSKLENKSRPHNFIFPNYKKKEPDLSTNLKVLFKSAFEFQYARN